MANIQKIAAESLADIRSRDREEDFGFTDLSGGQLTAYTNLNFQDIIKDINKMYLKNPLAWRTITVKTGYVVGDGFFFKAKDEKVQTLLDDYWKRNNWHTNLEQRVNDFSINGEFLVIPNSTELTGIMEADYPFVGVISERARLRKYSDKIGKVKLGDELEWRDIMRQTSEEGFEGDVFLYQINKTASVDFGLSDLFVARDWMKMYDKSLFATMSRVGMLLSFVWDVLIKTKDKRVITKKLEYIRRNPPVPGSVRVHNESEVWSAESPQLNGSDIDSIYRVLKGQCITADGTPEFLFGLGGDVNLATARVMLKPYFKAIRARQKVWKNLLDEQFDYEIWQAIAHEMLTNKNKIAYQSTFPDPDDEKITELAETLLQVANASVILQTNNVISEEDSRNLVSLLFKSFGLELTDDTQSNSKVNDIYNRLAKNILALKGYGNSRTKQKT